MDDLIERLAAAVVEHAHRPYTIDDYALTQDEIAELTGWRRAADQMKMLETMEIKAFRLQNNTVRVLRRDLLTPHAQAIIAARKHPKLVL